MSPAILLIFLATFELIMVECAPTVVEESGRYVEQFLLMRDLTIILKDVHFIWILNKTATYCVLNISWSLTLTFVALMHKRGHCWDWEPFMSKFSIPQA
jgi:hypothetical protein